MKRLLVTLLAGCALSACSSMGLNEPKTLGELNTGYNYIPVDPLEVTVLTDGLDPLTLDFPKGTTAKAMRRLRYGRCVSRSTMDDAKDPVPPPADKHSADVMDALPDHTIRLAIREMSASGSGGFGPVALSVGGTGYQVVMDSIFADTTNVAFGIRVSGAADSVYSLPEKILPGTQIEVVRLKSVGDAAPPGFEKVTIPLYVGVGLRLTANLFTRKGNINLANLTAVAATVEAKQSSGSLTMQTLGVYNQQVASTFAIPTELSTTSVQNALVSLGAVKAIVYDRDTGTRPRLTGIYNPLPTSDPRLINKIYSALALEPIPWRPCSYS